MIGYFQQRGSLIPEQSEKSSRVIMLNCPVNLDR